MPPPANTCDNSEASLLHLGSLCLGDLECNSSLQPSSSTSQDDDYGKACDDGNSDEAEKHAISFNQRRCLFCKSHAVGFEASLTHMAKEHSFLIPKKAQLIVESETLIKYLHLVIFGYLECLYCGCTRSTVQGIQQHMIGKGHCKIDVDQDASEFRDFYQEEGAQGDDKVTPDGDADAPFESWTLPSGSIIAHRSNQPRVERGVRQRPLMHPKISHTRAPSMDVPVGQSGSKRLVKREAAFQAQLSSLRATDRASLMHLPTWKQRALLLESKRSVDKARREENQMLLNIQLRANKTHKG